MNKRFCGVTSNPVVRKIAKEYHLTKEDALIVYNNTLQRDATLQRDDVSFKDIKESPAFARAIKPWTKNAGAVSHFIGTDIREDVKSLTEEFKAALGNDFSDEEIADIIDRALNVTDESVISNISAKRIASVLSAFTNSRRLEYLGDWVCNMMSSLATDLENSAALRKKYGVKKFRSRAEYYTDPNANRFIQNRTKAYLRDAIEYQDNDQLKKELQTVLDNFNTVLFMFGSRLYDTEGIRVGIEGAVDRSREDTDMDRAQTDNLGDEELSLSFSASDSSESVTGKIDSGIRAVLRTLLNVDHNGEAIADQYGYGLESFVGERRAVDSILHKVQGCQTYDEMVTALNRNLRSAPWLQQLLDYLDDQKKNLSQGRREQLQTLFFTSFRKQFTEYVSSFTVSDEDGVHMETSSANRSSSANEMYIDLENKFFSQSGTALHSGKSISYDLNDKRVGLGKISYKLEEILGNGRKGLLGRISGSYDEAPSHDLERRFGDAEELILEILEDFGLEVTREQLYSYLDNQSLVSDGKQYVNPDAYIRYNNLAMLAEMLKMQVRNFKNLEKYANEKKGTNPEISAEIQANPLSETIPWKDGKYGGNGNIRGMYRRIIDMLTKFDTDDIESMAYVNGKSFYSFNNPSTVQTIIENLTGKNATKRKEYITRKYGQDRVWFMRDGSRFFSETLNLLMNTDRPLPEGFLSYSEKVSINGASYDEVSDADYALSILNDFFDYGLEGDVMANYRMFISSDKPKYARIKLRRFTGENYKSDITERGLSYFAQEMRRAREVINSAALGDPIRFKYYDIKIDSDDKKKVFEKIKKGERVTIDDVVKDGRYIFRGTGASFYFNKFINDSIERKSKLGRFVIDRLFNQKSENKQDKLIPDDFVQIYKDGFADYMNRIKENYKENLKNYGVYDNIANSLLNWHRQEGDQYAQKLARIGIEAGFDEDLDNFVYNNWYAKAETIQIFDVDPAFYGDTVTFQKRNAQVTSSGMALDPNAKLHGKAVSDGKFRSITIDTKKEISDFVASVKAIRSTQPSHSAQEQRDLDNAIQDIANKLSKVDPTDGQALTSLTSLRKRLASSGEWTRSDTEEEDNAGVIRDADGNVVETIMTDEAIYQRIRRHEATTQDWLHVFTQVQKPFAYGMDTHKRKTGRTLSYPFQHKNSEYMLSFLLAYAEEMDPNSKMAGIAKFLEWSAYRNGTYMTDGIDTVNFESAVKIGDNSGHISIDGLNATQVFEKLKAAAYSNNSPVSGIVTEYDIADYKIQQANDDHFKNNQQQLGSQMKFLSINNISDNAQIPVDVVDKNGNRKKVVMTGAEVKKRYFDAFNTKTQRSVRDFRNELGLDLPADQRIHKLSNLVKRWLSGDARNGVDYRNALSITDREGDEVFNLPWDDPTMQQSLEAMVFSKIRKTFYRQKTNGGIAVQVSSWGNSEDLNIIFTSKNAYDIQHNNGLLQTKRQFAERNKNLTGKDLDDAYKAYAAENTSGLSHFEMEITMPDYIRRMLQNPDGTIDNALFDKEGHWNMQEIRERLSKKVNDVDALFEAIAYRIPTESKYSMMPGKIVRFADEGSGSVAKFPIELTVFSGSDFDIDKSFIELRPLPDSRNNDVDNEIFSLQYGALRSQEGLWEALRAGDFSDLSEMSYKTNVMLNGDQKLSSKQIDDLSADDAKMLSQRIEDLDFMDPSTDILLHAQNAEAKEMIGIAAVGVASHAAISTFNDPNASLNEKTTIKLWKPTRNNPFNELFTVVNDAPGHLSVWEGNETKELDPVYDVEGHLVGYEIGKYVGASADAAKDAALYRMNITKETMPLLISMHRVGIPANTARMFIAQPVFRELVSRMKNNPKYRNMRIGDATMEMQRELAGILGYESSNIDSFLASHNNKHVTIKYSDLVKHLTGESADPEADIIQDLDLLHVLITVSKLSNAIHNLDAFSRYNSTAAMKGSSFLERFAERQKLNRLGEVLYSKHPRIQLPARYRKKEGYGGLENMFPQIATAIIQEQDLFENVILENEKTYGIPFFRAANLLGIDSDAEALKLLHEAWKNYLLFAGPMRIAEFSDPKTARDYTIDFIKNKYETNEVVQKMNSGELWTSDDPLANNSFLRSLGQVQVEHPYTGQPMRILVTNITGADQTVKDRYMRDWEALLDDNRTRQLATNLAIHFLTRQNGAAFGNTVPTASMPARIKEEIPGYIESFEHADQVNMDDDRITDFIVKACLNNLRNDALVPKITLSNANMESVMRSGQLVITKEDFSKIESHISRPDQYGNRRFMPYVIDLNIEGSQDHYILTTVGNEFSKEQLTGGAPITLKVAFASMLGAGQYYQEYSARPYFNGSVLNGNLQPREGTDPAALTGRTGYDTSHKYNSRVGTYITNSPYRALSVERYDQLDRSLAKNDRDRSRNRYLESRRFLKRTDKIAESLGLNIKSTHRQFGGWVDTETGKQIKESSYRLVVTPDSYESSTELHERAKLLAMLSGTLGYQAQDGNGVITYTDDERQANGIEFRIKLNVKDKDYSKVFSILHELKLDDGFSLDTDANELYFIREKVRENLADLKELASRLASSKLAEGVPEVNYVISEFIDSASGEREKAFNEIINNNGKTVYQNGAAVQGSQSGRTGRDQESDGRIRSLGLAGTSERLRDYASAALRIERGEGLSKQELAGLFGERTDTRMLPTSMSYESTVFVDNVTQMMESGYFAQLQNALKGFEGDLGDRIDSVIINTANWILANNEEKAGHLLRAIGMSGEGAQDILASTREIIERNNLC